MNTIDFYNSKGLSFTLGVNTFADLTKEEYKSQLGYKKLTYHKTNDIIIKDIPDKVDWRKNGKVTPVRNQGVCGSCWAHGAAASFEGTYSIKYNQLFKFSEQQLVDCTRDFGNWGCDGGDQDLAYKYLQITPFCLERDYEYKGVDQKCDTTCKGLARVLNYTDVPNNSTNALKAAISMAPVAVSVDSEHDMFEFYKSGIIDSLECGTYLDHVVTAVGYDVSNSTEYFIVKNSYGQGWGIDGYVHIATGHDTDGGICGILTGSSYVNDVESS